MKAFVIAEHADAAAQLCAGARTMADEVVLIAVGGSQVPEACADQVLTIAVPAGAVYEDAADTVIAAFDAQQPGVVLAEPTRRNKIIAGKLAGHAGASVITDVLSFEGKVASSMYFGGVGVKQQEPIGTAFYTVGGGVFADAQPSGANATQELEWVAPAKPVKLVASQPVEKSGVDLTKCGAVVAAGRGFAEEADLDLARALCDKIGAGLGCSRPLAEGVDWMPKETYIGVSGLMLAPKVYVAAGVSGQMQHMVGANRSGVVFAINKDKNAPVFKQCDYGIVGDIKTVLPALVAAL
ncbi:MAG: electron transfer flavoprotein subunit alpha/FixB family protein [Coriobacteriales bacterium]